MVEIFKPEGKKEPEKKIKLPCEVCGAEGHTFENCPFASKEKKRKIKRKNMENMGKEVIIKKEIRIRREEK
jgi:hypothetical protein